MRTKRQIDSSSSQLGALPTYRSFRSISSLNSPCSDGSYGSTLSRNC